MIDDFHGEYYWLDNMWVVPIQWSHVLEFNSVEQGFVFFKTEDPANREAILKISDPYDAKAFGRSMYMRPDWDHIKFGIMYELVRKKFMQNEDLQEKLLDTGPILLVEGNSWHDNIWGECHCANCAFTFDQGQNWLGKILMSIRAQLKDRY